MHASCKEPWKHIINLLCTLDNLYGTIQHCVVYDSSALVPSMISGVAGMMRVTGQAPDQPLEAVCSWPYLQHSTAECGV